MAILTGGQMRQGRVSTATRRRILLPGGAEEAYQLWTGDMPVERYLLCYSDRIVTFRADWTLTEAEMAVAGERLKTY